MREQQGTGWQNIHRLSLLHRIALKFFGRHILVRETALEYEHDVQFGCKYLEIGNEWYGVFCYQVVQSKGIDPYFLLVLVAPDCNALLFHLTSVT